MVVGNLYVVKASYLHSSEDVSDLFILTRLETKPPTKGENRDWLPIGFFLNLRTGESLKINHPESVFVPINGLDSNDIAETKKIIFRTGQKNETV